MLVNLKEVFKYANESNKYIFYHEIAHQAYLGMKEDSLKAMKIFYKKF